LDALGSEGFRQFELPDAAEDVVVVQIDGVGAAEHDRRILVGDVLNVDCVSSSPPLPCQAMPRSSSSLSAAPGIHRDAAASDECARGRDRYVFEPAEQREIALRHSVF
jgi:hypothetical protein